MTAKYHPKQIQQIFNKSAETVRLWSIEYAAFLSLDANPSSGHRRYTDDDLAVFAHVNVRKGEGATTEQVIAELTNGQRTELPRETLALVVADERSELAILQETVVDLREQITRANTRADRAEGAIQAVTAAMNEMHRNEIERLERRLSESEQRARELIEENARLKAKD